MKFEKKTFRNSKILRIKRGNFASDAYVSLCVKVRRVAEIF